MALTPVILMCAVVMFVFVDGDGRYCGDALSNALTLVCMGRGGYNVNKRSFNDQDTFNTDIEEWESEEITNSLMDRRLAIGLLRNRPFRQTQHKRSGGIVEECCRRSCTWVELSSYCASK